MSFSTYAKRYLHAAGRTARVLAAGATRSGRQPLRDLSDFLAGDPRGGAAGDARGASADGRPPVLRPIDLDAIWPSTRPIGLTELAASSHNVNERELAILCALAMRTEAQRLFEFGTFDGRTSANLLRNCPDAHLFTLDLPDEDVLGGTMSSTQGGVGRRLRAPDMAGRFTQIRSWSDQYDYAPYEASIDFVFIDAGHSYEAVRNDSLAAARMLRPGGIIAWHDYGHLRGFEPFPGLTRAVDEFFLSGNAPGVGMVGVWFLGTRVAACVPQALLDAPPDNR